VLGHLSARGRKIFVMGDMLELGEKEEFFHRQAGFRIAKVCDVFIAVGELSKATAHKAHKCGFNEKNLFVCSTSKEAREILFNRVVAGPRDVVLVKGSRSMKMEEVLREE
jgi:UDP-N-acetylmuramoyl-tripeptide--D-alanyl-D-alanine ligase